MQNDTIGLIKNALIEYVKSHNEHSGKIMEFFDKVDGATKIAQSLPIETQNDLRNIILSILVANGIMTIPFGNY